MTYLDKVLQNRVLSHAFYWLGVLLLAPFLAEIGDGAVWTSFIYRAVGLPLKILATYSLVYFLIPTFFNKKKYFQFIIAFLIHVYIFTLVYRINNVYIAETLAGLTAPKESIREMLEMSLYSMISYFPRAYLFAFLFLFIKLVKDGAEEKRKIESLQKEKATTELNFLKAQIHPHFLFNTLNNLYVLTLDKSDAAPEVVIKLSEMLDYMLYQCNDDNVLISKEVELIQNYIDLELLRYGERLDLSFNHEIENAQTKIAPLVLLSVVENAFKHGASATVLNPRIDISLEVKEGELKFKVYNTKAAIVQDDEKNYKKGIGIQNIKRQLELVYPGKYEWQNIENENSYEVVLTIDL